MTSTAKLENRHTNHQFGESMTDTDEKETLGQKTENPQNAVGARIRELRLQNDYSQEVLARMCGISATQLGRIERGAADVSIETLAIIAKKLDTTAAQILGVLKPSTEAEAQQHN